MVKIKNRLAFRLARTSVLLAFAIGMLLSLIQVIGDYRDQEVLIEQTIEKILMVSQPPASRAVNTLDKALANEVVEGLLGYPYVENARISDELNQVLAEKGRKIISSKTRWITRVITDEQKSYITKLVAPKYAGIDPGSLALIINMDEALASFFNRSVFVFISGVTRNFLLVFALFFLFHLVLTKPLEKLAKQFENLRPGKANRHKLEVPPKHSATELGLVAEAGNQFVFTVEQLMHSQAENSRALKQSEKRLLSLINQVPQLIFALNQSANIVFANQKFFDFYQLPENKVVGTKLQQLHQHLAREVELIEVISQIVFDQSLIEHIPEIKLTPPMEESRTYAVQITPFKHFEEAVTLVVATDITEQKKTQQKIRDLARRDSLTGLPNRIVLADRLGQSLRESKRSNQNNGLLFLDLDNFKDINDSLGHDIGDQLLIEISKKLRHLVRDDDTVCRLGGDEFVILLNDLGIEKKLATKRALKFCQKMLTTFSAPIHVPHHDLQVGASIGVVVYPFADADFDDLLRYADTAMYQAKADGRNQAVLYQHDMSEALDYRLLMENQLQNALLKKQFVIYFQPQVDLSGQLTGLEALIRWQHPERGLVPPGEFISTLESSGLIVPVSQWLLKECCSQILQWQKKGYWKPGMHVAINISPHQFYQSDFVEDLRQALHKAKLPAHSICVEITETVAIENVEFTANRLKEIKLLGIPIALDDFGTGYSSLSYLRELPLDILKIDQSFIQQLSENSNDLYIVEAIISMALQLGKKVIAEGVETEEQLKLVSRAGCKIFQGYYFNKPMPAKALMKAYFEPVAKKRNHKTILSP